MLARIEIFKESRESRITNDTISIYVDKKDLTEYKKLLAKTWPKTDIREAMSNRGVA